MKIINDDAIVTLETAKLARKKGFNLETDFGHCYDSNKEAYYLDYDPMYFLNDSLLEKHYAAPSREQLYLWLQKHGVYVIIDVDQTFEPKFVYKVNRYLGDGNWDNLETHWSDLYHKYEVAFEAGLLEGLNKL